MKFQDFKILMKVAIIDMIMVEICYKINDITALDLYMDGLVKLRDEPLIIHDVLREMLNNYEMVY